MRFLGRRRRPVFDTGNAMDDELLALITKSGDLSAPRHWVHYLVCPDEASAGRAAELAHDGDWEVVVLPPDTTRDPEATWAVTAERRDVVVSPEAVAEARTFFDDVAVRVPGCEYDGWEAAL